LEKLKRFYQSDSGRDRVVAVFSGWLGGLMISYVVGSAGSYVNPAIGDWLPKESTRL